MVQEKKYGFDVTEFFDDVQEQSGVGGAASRPDRGGGSRGVPGTSAPGDDLEEAGTPSAAGGVWATVKCCGRTASGGKLFNPILIFNTSHNILE